MTEAVIERAYYGPWSGSIWGFVLWFVFIGLWLGFAVQLVTIGYEIGSAALTSLVGEE